MSVARIGSYHCISGVQCRSARRRYNSSSPELSPEIQRSKCYQSQSKRHGEDDDNELDPFILVMRGCTFT